MSIKPTITPEKLNRVNFSLQKMALLAQIMLLELQTELVDTKFNVPLLNNFCKRIISDSKAISDHLHKSGKITVKVKDSDFVEDYSGEIWTVITLLAGIDIEIIKEFSENLKSELEAIGV